MFDDNELIKETFKLAKKAEGAVSPNPLVGAIIVKDGRILSRGFHRRAGLAHAEIEAINRAKEDISGSTLYINLEPCCHYGRTPPCLEQIIARKIKKVVIATKDPNPKVEGKSIRKLKSAGVSVKVGLLSREARQLNEIFFKNMEENKPFVVAKVAQSLDGKIATAGGISKWITTSSSREFAKSLRDKYDSVLIGSNTFIKDNPHLRGIKKDPLKIIISPNLIVPTNSFILKEAPDKLIFFSSEKNRQKAKKIPSSVRIFFLKDNKGELSLDSILKICYRLGIMSIFVEGGSETLGRFFFSKLVDKVHFFISPRIIGGKEALTSVGAKGFSHPKIAPFIKNIEINRIGKDIAISGYPYYQIF